MNEKNLLQMMTTLARRMRGSKLDGVDGSTDLVSAIAEAVGLVSREEVLAFVTIFDRQCSGEGSTLIDISAYLDCTVMEVMVIVSSLRRMLSAGFLTTNKPTERDIQKQEYKVNIAVYTAIVDGRPVVPVAPVTTDNAPLTLCDAVHSLIDDRVSGAISTEEMFALVAQLEAQHSSLFLVSALTGTVPALPDRTFFYEMCHDFKDSYTGGTTALTTTIKDLYDDILCGIRQRRTFLDETNRLITAGLVYIHTVDRDDTSLRLTNEGIALLFPDDATAFVTCPTYADQYAFVNAIDDFTDDIHMDNGSWAFRSLYRRVREAEKSNSHLPAVATIVKLVPEVCDRVLFYSICKEAIDGDTCTMRCLNYIYTPDNRVRYKKDMKLKKHILQVRDLMALNDESFVDRCEMSLTDKGKELFFGDDKALFSSVAHSDNVISHKTIVEKRLFFDAATATQLHTLRESLAETHLTALRQRLRDRHLPTGIAVLLYGLPGTGKTESVLQMARATGRDVLHVDIASTKSCWFGESEKLIKGVFTEYAALCKRCSRTPILLFNEADGIFSKRKDVNSSNVAQTENAIQNIILEELEQLDGIVIATTNLVDNLDRAFERRFLYKIRFTKPTVESKCNIWQSKLPQLSGADALRLANTFDLSGGEIDNIVRKAEIDEVITGEHTTIDRLITLCHDEKLADKSPKLGF